jgi:hypothetical protein
MLSVSCSLNEHTSGIARQHERKSHRALTGCLPQRVDCRRGLNHNGGRSNRDNRGCHYRHRHCCRNNITISILSTAKLSAEHGHNTVTCENPAHECEHQSNDHVRHFEWADEIGFNLAQPQQSNAWKHCNVGRVRSYIARS